MAMTAMQAAEERAKAHGISIQMNEDFNRDSIVVRGRMGDLEYRHSIARHEVLRYRAEHVDEFYALAYHKVIAALIDGKGKDVTQHQITKLEMELTKYKETVKRLSFQLEMAERGGKPAMLKEDEVRRLALEQAAEHLMDHGVITSGRELVEVCEQIKKLQRHDMKLPSEIGSKLPPPWSIVELKSGEVPF